MRHKGIHATYPPTPLELGSDILHNIGTFPPDLLCEPTAQLFQLCTAGFHSRIQILTSQHIKPFVHMAFLFVSRDEFVLVGNLHVTIVMHINIIMQYMKSTSFRLSDIEKEHIDKYCELTERNLSDVLRQYIRSLSIKGVLSPLDGLAIPPDAHRNDKAQGS
jgi:hypothetical protein